MSLGARVPEPPNLQHKGRRECRGGQVDPRRSQGLFALEQGLA